MIAWIRHLVSPKWEFHFESFRSERVVVVIVWKQCRCCGRSRLIHILK